MKKLILILFISFCGVAIANAQQIIYQSPEQQRQSSQQQSQSIRTTAYYADSYGNYYKVPIRIQQQGSAWYVVEYYTDGGIGGNWHRMAFPAVSKCNSMFATNQLEKQFMYKAFVNAQTYYFDF